MKVEVEVPEGFEKEVKELIKHVDWDAVLAKALKKELQEELEIELLRKIASKSKLSERDALRISGSIKEGIARRHGLS